MKFLVVHKILKNTLEIKCLQLPLNKFLCLETNLSKYFKSVKVFYMSPFAFTQTVKH